MKFTNTRSLRIALVTNALFSLTSGMLMIFESEVVGAWLGITSLSVLQVIGVGLLIFSADLFHQATRPRIVTWRALYASAGDFLWVISTFVLIVLFPSMLSQTGNGLAVLIAIAVAIFGVWQVLAIGEAHRIKGSELYRHCILIRTDVAPDAMWRVINNLGAIKKYSPMLKKSVVLDGESSGIGAVRMCENRAGKCWSEECVDYNEGKGFEVRFQSEAPDFPFPAKTMRGGWEILPHASDNGSDIMVWWELEPKPKYLSSIIMPLLAFQADRDFPKVVQRMAADAIETAPDTSVQKQSISVAARLLPKLC